MNTTAHTITSTAIATLLALFTALSATISGLGSNATITGISLFVALGMIEIMIQSYAAPSDLLGRMRDARDSRQPDGALVPFQTAPNAVRKAA